MSMLEEQAMRELLAPLRTVEPVIRRARRGPRRLGLIAGLSAAVLAVAGVALAAGGGLFPGIGAADHSRTTRDVPDATLARIIKLYDNANKALAARLGRPPVRLLPGTSRFLRALPSGGRIYVLTTSADSLCMLAETAGKYGAEFSCGPQLTRGQPTTVGESHLGPASLPVAIGLAQDDVRSVSFRAGGKLATVRVRDNVWFYIGSNAALRSLTVHYADGTSRRIAH